MNRRQLFRRSLHTSLGFVAHVFIGVRIRHEFRHAHHAFEGDVDFVQFFERIFARMFPRNGGDFAFESLDVSEIRVADVLGIGSRRKDDGRRERFDAKDVGSLGNLDGLLFLSTA